MRNQIVLLMAMLLGAWGLPSANRLVAQQIFDDYITHPDVWRPAKPIEPGVDSGGDLNVSIPVLTVPGRNGLSYPVRFSYRSGITLKQQASWIGLGWSFDPGSITRDVHGITERHEGGVTIKNVDYIDVMDEQPDMYYVTTPGGSFTMARRHVDAGLKPPRSGLTDFYLTAWQPWKIETTTDSPVTVSGYQTLVDEGQAGVTLKDDFDTFTLTAPDGTRYLFEKKTLATFEGNYPFAQPVETYVKTWRLTAILGADYAGNTPPSGSNDPGGSWIRLEYHDIETATKSSPTPQNIIQSTRLSKIVTPTHEAVFESESYARQIPIEPYDGNPVRHYQLDGIKLYEQHGSGQTLVQEVTLGHTVNGHTGVPVHRRSFDNIRFYGEGGADASSPAPLPGYTFTYYPTDGTAQVNEDNTDDFGFFNDGDSGEPGGGKSWSLESITHPTGGTDVISYENDGITLPFDGGGNPGLYHVYYDLVDDTQGASNGTGLSYAFSTISDWQGGARVTTIERFETAPSSNPIATTTYTYSNSRVSGVPPLYWERTYGANNSFFMPSGRGRSAVFYEDVTATFDDGTSSTTHYTTDLFTSVEPLDAILYRIDGSVSVVQGNQDINWGLPFKTTSSLGRSERQLDIGAVKLASALTRGTILAEVEWRYANKVDSEERAEYRGSNLGAEGEIVARTDYTYDFGSGSDDATLFVKTIAASGYGVVKPRVTERTYAFEEYSALETAHILSPVIREDVAEDNGGSLTYYRSQVTTWKSFPVLGVWRPFEAYQWKTGQPGAKPSFTQWSGGSPGSAWQRQVTFDTYDAYGNLLTQTDARGITVEFFYGNNTSPFSSSGHFNHALLTGIRIGGSTGLTSTLRYDEQGRLTEIRNANDRKGTFTYDAFGRLVDVENDAGAVISHNDYHLSRCNATNCDDAYDITDPNSVRTSLYTGGNTYLTTEYIDAYGRTIQTQQQDGSNDIISTILYDALGRETHLYKPHLYANPSHGYVSAPSAIIAAGTYYDGNPGPDAFGRPYTESIYDRRGRLDRRYLPAIESTPDFQAFGYWLDAQSSTTGDAVAITVAADEEGHATLTYTNALGQNVLTRRFVEKDALPGVPQNINLSASISNHGGQSQSSAPSSPQQEEFDWVTDSAIFTVPETQVVFYTITLDVSGVGGASVTYYEDNAPIRKISFDEAQPIHTGFFTAYAGISYKVEATAGVPIPGGSDGEASATASFTFQDEGKVTVLNATGFEYNGADDLVKVRPPNFYDPPVGSNASDWETEYVYNTLGQLTEKTTPDTDAPFEYAYDAGGNLRFIKDPNHTTRTGSGFLYNEYDVYGRLIEMGVYTGPSSFSFAAGNYADQAWPVETDGAEVVEYVYDDYAVDCAQYGRHGFNTCPSIPSCGSGTVNTCNPQGNLTQVIFDDGYYHYFYDNEGRVSEFYVFLDEALDGKLVEFEYDRQGNVTQVSYQAGQPDALYHWYTYDNLGRLASVKTHLEDDLGAAVEEAQYSYTATSQVQQLGLGTDAGAGSSLLSVDYQYNSRDWLTQINDPAALGADKFAMRLGYNQAVVVGAPVFKNGNVGSAEWITEGNTSNIGGTTPISRIGYAFEYDALNRLEQADFQYHESDWNDHAAYDVGMGVPIDYDPNGNILKLERANEEGNASTINYHYQDLTGRHRNRLQSVSEGLTADFAYDPNGNMTQSRVANNIAHDRRNLPIQMTLGTQVLTLGYDADGQRISKALDDGGGSVTKTFYVRRADGSVLAVYVDDGGGGGPQLQYWNILSGGAVIGRIVPASGTN